MKNFTAFVEADKRAQEEVDGSLKEKNNHIEDIKERIRGLREEFD